MSDSNHSSKVTIEDLLHLKRAERPAADFWTDFERELRQKQLAALLEKRPWWQDLPQLFARRAYLPVGATAILAFTLVSVKYSTLPAPVARMDGAAEASHSVAVIHSNESLAARAATAPASSPLVNRREAPAVEAGEHTLVRSGDSPAFTKTDEHTPVVAATVSAETPSARSIAANFARMEQSEPELFNAVLGSRLSSRARVQPAAGPVLELASLSNNASRRSRLLARYDEHAPSPELTAPEPVRERLSRRLGDAEAGERFNRIGLKGDQDSLGLTLRL